MNQEFEVGETVIYHAFTDEDVLVNYRGRTNMGQFGQAQAVVHNPASGVQGTVDLDRLDHTSLWRAVEAAKQAGHDEVLTTDGFIAIGLWRDTHQTSPHIAWRFDASMPALLDEVPAGRVQGVWRVRNARLAYVADMHNEIESEGGDA
jgi:hypothetical protein